ncbi:fasciclin domain-containing protein [Floridanema evergladense]|uniref:Fasciclin domain-containing protein n=1 Tax=Floridaenema evergladense BLCC-F167 TaxID=3153639 RepID=A0ABV4WUI2_9CYAN
MKAVNSRNRSEKLRGIVAVAGVSALISLPVLVQAQSGTHSGAMSTTSQPTVAPASAGTSVAQNQTIVAVASGNNNFSTLTAALKAAGLIETLSEKGPFTVFAPTNAAFDALGKDKVQALLKPENKSKLVKVLTYHVVPGQVLSTQIKPGAAKTVEGGTVNLAVKDGKVKVNNAQVTQADLKASNGVIHVIDTVLLPPDLKL